MALYGLVGYPLEHSLSPEIFREIFSSEGRRDCSYRLFPLLSVNRIREWCEEHPDLKGFNVTIPHKTSVIKRLDAISPLAGQAAAVNTVRVQRTNKLMLMGYNTDVPGFRLSLEPFLRPHHEKAMILGTGGSSRAVATALSDMGISYIFVSRKPAGQKTIGYDDLDKQSMEAHSLIVNCTPLGMFPDTGSCPAIPYQHIVEKHLCFDLVYNPEETLFLKKAKQMGATTVNGMAMLRIQAREAWKIWNE